MAKIYISSTYEDLKDYREKSYHSLRRLGHDVKAMEDYVASDQRPLDRCIQDVAGCEVYVGIFAWRYGYVPTDGNPDQMSITEHEFRHAVDLGKEVLIFLLDEDAPWPFSQIEQGEGLERIKAFRAELSHEYNVSLFANADDLAAKLNTAVSLSKASQSARGDGSTAPDPIGQIPPPPRDFTGRGDELAEFLDAVKSQGVTISGLQGLGGIGKTALALTLAEQLRDDYPDAQFYLDLKGTDETPISPADAMAHVLRSYYPNAQLPQDEAQIRGLYLSELQDKRAILFMDNARDSQQVEPLIPHAGCLLLVTSRQHFVLPGLYAKDLNTLPLGDAGDFILKIAPRIGNHASKIAELCGYLPIALRLAASAIAERRNLTPEQYINRLSDSRRRLELVDASLSLSYDLLSESLQTYWRALAVFPDTFDVEAASVVWGMEQDEAQDTLGELMRYSLVDWNDTSQRYRLHDLANVYADSRLNEGERATTQRLHSQHYERVLRRANALYLEGGGSVMQGLGLFDVEVTNILAGQAWTAEHIDDHETAAELCNSYPDAGAHVLEIRLHPRDRIEWLESGLAAARRLNRRSGEAAHLGNLGIAYHRLGEYRRAIEYHEQCLGIAREIGDRRSEGQLLGNLGTAYHALGGYRRAIEYHEQLLVIAREIGDRLGEGASLGNLGTAYYALGEYRRAIEYHEQCLSIEREIGDRLGEGQSLGNLGIAYHALGEYRRAIEYHEQDLEVARDIGDRLGEGQSLGNLGLSYNRLGEFYQAIDNHEQSLNIKREIGDRHGEADSLLGLAIAQQMANEITSALTNAEAALKIYQQIESPRVEMAQNYIAQWRAQSK